MKVIWGIKSPIVLVTTQTLIWGISVKEMAWPSQYLCKLEWLKIFVRNILRKREGKFWSTTLVHIGTHIFQITFQVRDIVPAYSCLLGRPWIHEAWVVTLTLHQKLKFIHEGKVVITNSEKALLISHLSSFSIVEVDEVAVGTQFQDLYIDNIRKNEDSITSFKNAQQVVQKGPSKV